MNEVSVLGIAFDEANEMAAVILTMEGAKKVVPIPIDINELF
jgi:bifunctional DNase/RNase